MQNDLVTLQGSTMPCSFIFTPSRFCSGEGQHP